MKTTASLSIPIKCKILKYHKFILWAILSNIFALTAWGQKLEIGSNHFIKVQHIPFDTVVKYLDSATLGFNITPEMYGQIKNVKVKYLGKAKSKNSSGTKWELFKILLSSRQLKRVTKQHQNELPKDQRKSKSEIRDELNKSTIKILSSFFPHISEPYYNIWRGVNIGGYTVPVRSRRSLDVFAFDADLSLGGSLLARVGLRRHEYKYLDLSIGLGTTKINFDDTNTNGNPELSGGETATSLTSSIGLVATLAKDVRIGVYTGWDKLASADASSSRWIYNGKPWYGLGIGLTITKENNKNDALR